jgi:hypothetical protein
MGSSEPAHRDIDRKAELALIKEYDVAEAEQFWVNLSPKRKLFSPKNSPIHSTPSPGKWRKDGAQRFVALRPY